MADTLTISRPVQLVIDDVGWREGWNVSEGGGPYRAGVDRLLGPADYHVVADIGQRLTVRPQCAMVLCEWDTENVCAEYPTATHAGADWDNSARIGPSSSQPSPTILFGHLSCRRVVASQRMATAIPSSSDVARTTFWGWIQPTRAGE